MRPYSPNRIQHILQTSIRLQSRFWLAKVNAGGLKVGLDTRYEKHFYKKPLIIWLMIELVKKDISKAPDHTYKYFFRSVFNLILPCCNS